MYQASPWGGGAGRWAGNEARESEPRPSLLFAILLHSSVSAEQKWGRPGNEEATFNLYLGVWVDERCWSKCTTVMYVVVNFKK